MDAMNTRDQEFEKSILKRVFGISKIVWNVIAVGMKMKQKEYGAQRMVVKEKMIMIRNDNLLK